MSISEDLPAELHAAGLMEELTRIGDGPLQRGPLPGSSSAAQR